VFVRFLRRARIARSADGYVALRAQDHNETRTSTDGKGNTTSTTYRVNTHSATHHYRLAGWLDNTPELSPTNHKFAKVKFAKVMVMEPARWMPAPSRAGALHAYRTRDQLWLGRRLIVSYPLC
jgi:hypothetical protein